MQCDLNRLNSRSKKENEKYLIYRDNPYDALEGCHAVAIMTEWDDFKKYDWNEIYKKMEKPAFIFDGRNILNRYEMEKIGFVYKGIGL